MLAQKSIIEDPIDLSFRERRGTDNDNKPYRTKKLTNA